MCRDCRSKWQLSAHKPKDNSGSTTYGKEGDMLEPEDFCLPAMKVNKASSADFIARGGHLGPS